MNATQFVSHANRLADISRDIIREEIYRPREVTVKSDATQSLLSTKRLSEHCVKQ